MNRINEKKEGRRNAAFSRITRDISRAYALESRLIMAGVRDGEAWRLPKLVYFIVHGSPDGGHTIAAHHHRAWRRSMMK